jgi:glycosyltransferase involved in cell wall biosynthesis
MRASIVIAVLDSHEVLRRQLLHFERMALPDDVEVIIVDDGSDPPLTGTLKNLTIHATHDTRPWTQPIARNTGVRMAKGEWVICTDIDHILTRPLIDFVLASSADVVRFKREAGVLDENGVLTQDLDVLHAYGYEAHRGLRMNAHGNSYAIKRDLFLALGGSQQRTRYPNRDEQKIKRGLHKLGDKVTMITGDDRPTIYMIPNGRFCGSRDYNPFGLFHTWTREWT